MHTYFFLRLMRESKKSEIPDSARRFTNFVANERTRINCPDNLLALAWKNT